MSGQRTADPVNDNASAAKAWLRALELTASIPRNRNRILSTVIQEMADGMGDAPALLSDRECFTFRELFERANQYARWALDQGVAKGDVVALMMTNRPEYFAIWLGITRIGAVVALLNTNLVGQSLAHCINVVRPRAVIVSAEFAASLTATRPNLTRSPAIWLHGEKQETYRRLDEEIERYSNEVLSVTEHRSVSVGERALYIFTSGTTGLPKAVNTSHARVMQWSLWFAGMMGVQPQDRMYSCLPMYHSIGGVLAPGAVLAGGGSVVVREKFSASQFWSDVSKWDCTMFQYIGELCRYLLHSAPVDCERRNRIRLACGNGLAADVWDRFKSRFGIPRILEFYASTEGGVSLFNVEEKRGATGRIPPYLTHRFSPVLIRIDLEEGVAIRNEDGLCIACEPNEVGEALGRLVDDPAQIGTRFEGYTDEKASEKKILRNVLKVGDAWIRTGDLMRKDEKGFFYFVDRIGDTFRWKGENVAASEVSDAICSFPGVKHANVYGVTIAANEGRAGMAAVVTNDQLDFSAFRKHLKDRLPSYARPLFLRLQDGATLTGTFKYSKADLVEQGFDPAATTDAIYFADPNSQGFERIDQSLYERVQTGQIRL